MKNLTQKQLLRGLLETKYDNSKIPPVFIKAVQEWADETNPTKEELLVRITSLMNSMWAVAGAVMDGKFSCRD